MKNKRLISMLLALSMLLSILPTGLVSAKTNASEGYNYVFNSTAYGSSSGISQANLANYTFDNIDSGKSAPWKLASANRVASTLRTDYFKLEATRTNGESCFAIELKVDQGGTYLPKLTYTRSGQSGIVDIYLAKKGMDFKYGSIDINTSDLDSSESFSSQKCSATYNIAYYFDKGFPSGTDGAYVLKTDLDMYTGSGSDTVEDFGKRELALEGNTSYYLIFRIKNAHQDIIDAGKYWYALLNSFSLTPPGKEPVDEITSLSLSSASKAVFEGETLQLTAKAVYSLSGEKPLPGNVVYKSSDDTIAEVSQNGVVTGKKEGNVRITATLDGINISGYTDITVKKVQRATKELVYNFNSSVYGSSSNIAQATLANYTFGDVDSEKSEPWKLASLYRVAATLRTDDFKLEGVDKSGNEKACFAIELKVDEGGKYLPKLAYTRSGQTGIVDIYLAKKGTSVTYDGSSYTTDDLDSSINTYNFLKGIVDGADGQYVLKTDLDMYEGADTATVEDFGKREIILEGNTSYYLIVNIKGANQAFSGVSYPYAFLNSFSLKPPVGTFDKASLSVRGLAGETEPMANMTSRQLEFKLYDDVGISFDEVDEEKLSVAYSSSDEGVATVDDNGVITAHSNGETVITANITYGDISRSAQYNLIVESSGKNMMENLNPDFEEDTWLWDSARNDEPPAEPVFMRTGITTEATEDDPDNRALAFTFNPDVPMPSGMATIFLQRNGKRVKMEPGRLYQLSFKVKTDIKKPSDGEYPTMRYSVYSYNNSSGYSSSDIVYISGRDKDINNVENWQETFSEWQELVIPIVAPPEYDGDTFYSSPRLNIRYPAESVGKTGYSGTIWMDDFELREVGFAGVEMEIQGDPTSGSGGFNVVAKPYTTLGHYISLDKYSVHKYAEFSCSDEHVVSSFKKPTATDLPFGAFAASSEATAGGKNAAAEIFATLTIGGVSRTGKTYVTTAGYDRKLLYAEAKIMPETVEVGNRAQVEPTGYMSDGTVADMSGGRIVYESLTPEVISVDESGKITTLRAGKGKVAVTLILSGASAYAEGEITVTDSSPIESASLSGPEKVGYLRDEPLILTGKMKSGYEADFTNADIKWIIGSNPANGVEVIDGNLVFGNIKGAVATISAEITMGGATVSTNEIEIEVGESDLRDFVINFGGVEENELGDVTIDKYGWALDIANSHSSALASYLYNNCIYVQTNGVDRDFAIDFEVPYTGYFTPVFVAGMSDGYGSEKTYIYIDGEYVGDYEFYMAQIAPRNLRSVYLEAGPHKLALRPVAKDTNSRNHYQYPGKVRFAAIPSLPGIKEIVTEKDEYEIAAGKTESVSAKLKLTDGFVYEWQKMRNGDADPHISIKYSSDKPDVATVDENGIITAVAEGECNIIVTVTINGIETPKEIPVSVFPEGSITADEVLDNVEIEAPYFVMNPEASGIQLTAVGKNAKGAAVDMTGAEIIWEIEANSVAEISEEGFVTPAALGSAKVTATVTLGGITTTGECYVSVREGKVGRTYYTDDNVAAARENIKKYSWAKDEAEAAIDAAEKYLGLEDTLWEMVPGEGIPRGNTVGFRTDPDRYTCRYCGVDLFQAYNNYPWIVNPLQRQWKIQCPDCKRLFPSNEFDKFYELGRDEHGIFNRELALERHQEMFGGTYGTGYLKNTLYPEVGTENCRVKLTGSETVEKWGVDDGFGYDTGRVYANGCKEVHTYIAYYNHWGLWYLSGTNPGMLCTAVDTLAEAYLYTGDEKYGKVGAILIDRMADVYPGYNLRPYLPSYSNSDGGAIAGKIVGSIWEVSIVRTFSKGYDAFFPMYDDPQVVSFLAEKAKKYNYTEMNDKSTPEKIRKNIENGLLREAFREVQLCSLQGNFGAHQSAIAQAAIVLDTHPDTDEMLDWLFAYSETDYTSRNTGGEISKRLINDVSRDGQGDESGPGYNRIWVTQIAEVASVLARYDESEGANLYEHPKYIGMVKSYAPLTLVRRGLAPIGDSGVSGKLSLLPDNDGVVIDAFKETRDIEIAQHLYLLKDGNLKELHYDIFTENPESLSDDVEEIIEKHGEYNYDKSSLLTGYGFGTLRDGTLHKADTSVGIRDTQHDFWMYFGAARSHSHSDRLNLGVEAYGLPLTSDLGYPETANKDPNRAQWQSATLSHNTVMVNEKNQDSTRFSGTPLHFDTKDTRVKVLDVDASVVYAATDEYRRTVVMVDYDDEISYGIDFFKVLGGDDHLYSFHASSNEDPETSENLSFKVQPAGSYAGTAVPYGPDPWSVTGDNYAVLKYPMGYTWLDDVKRADKPGTGEFFVDFKIKDFWKQTRNAKQDIHLRMTMVNDWAADEVTLANGMPPRTGKNMSAIGHYEYMLVRRKGRDLNTLFTTVVEPYDGSRYIKSISNVPVSVVDGTPGKNDIAKAVRVELVDGRIDYVVYAQNNNVTYRITDSENGYSFDFKGFVGVWTVKENADGNGFANIYSYVNDGEMIGDDEFKYENLDATIEGTITDFQDELSFDNWIEAELDCELTQEEADDLSGRIINVEREALGNSTYVIESVEMLDSTHARINLGNVTLISGFVDAKNEDLGYKYDVAVGKNFDIPMSYEDNCAPVFDEVADNITTSAGSSVSVTVNATGDEGATVTYRARTLPRGASLNSETGTFTWKPDSSQVGDNLVAIDAVDEYGRITTQYFTVTVYGSTTGSKNETSETPEAGNTDTPAGGGGGGGGGAAPTPDTETTPDDAENIDENDDVQNDSATAPDASGETDDIRFTDLGNHTWASDAINTLADDGIIKGTTARTYSPQNNITRADFASLLVRAFKLTSDNAENFADVAASDYFAAELAIARNNGIISGIGDNKFAPRNHITRQDMMVIVYRALATNPVGEGLRVLPSTDEVEINYHDFTAVAHYAADAVSALIGAGIVNGKSGRIAPTDYTTRAEVAVLIKRILDYIK